MTQQRKDGTLIDAAARGVRELATDTNSFRQKASADTSRNIQKPKSRTVGFTIVELIVASCAFLIMAVAFIACLLGSMRTHEMSRNYYKATCLARNLVQRARTLSWSSLSLLNESDSKVDDDGNVVPDGRFRRTTTVTNVAADCVELTTSVSFPTANGISDAPLEIKTLIYKLDLEGGGEL